ncbi:Helix-turn-helix domain-containing protein [Nannocystis exedens]|uniref:Helix-turn-helix domain-containing protein n=1 Tax=Nannocystis exedens TaxID=54 RepID=A0A1I1Y987_9BACT|nr:AraC family transcriptional regulator [Nannocystis exedens]PCC71806.1 Right origin-binding protein [Nannocystis exedens]SFE14440.1 Helix-turn-helix domain-containing protein [Nannocystis exedens]
MSRAYAVGPEARAALAVLLLELQDALDEPWTLETMAARVGYDPSHFARAFQTVVGQPPLRWLRTLRLERAAHDLVFAPARPLQVVAEEAGYASHEAFRRAFVRAFGVPPSAMRRRPRGLRGAAPRPQGALQGRPEGLSAAPEIVRFGPLASAVSVVATRFDDAAIAEAWRRLYALPSPASAWELAAASPPWGFTRPGRPREYRCIRLGYGEKAPPGFSPWRMQAGWFARFRYEGTTPGIHALMTWIFRDWLPGSALRWRFAPVVTLFDPEAWHASRFQRSRCAVHVPVQSLGGRGREMS